MIIYDDKDSTDGGKAAAERLVNQDQVKFMVGQYSGNAISGTLTVTEPAKILVFHGAAPDLYQSPKIQYAFRAISYVGLPAKWLWITEAYPKVKTVVYISPDHVLGHGQGDLLGRIFKGIGLNKLRDFYLTPGTKDFSPVAASVVAMNPDIVDVCGFVAGADLGLLLKALYESGYRNPKVMENFSEPDIIPVSGKQAAENFICRSADSTQTAHPTPIAAKIRKMYEEKIGTWNSNGAKWIDPFYLFIAAVQKADSVETTDVLAALSKGLTFNGYFGKSRLIKRPDLGTFRYVDTVSEVAVQEYQGGKLVPKTVVSPEDGIKTVEKILGTRGSGIKIRSTKWGLCLTDRLVKQRP